MKYVVTSSMSLEVITDAIRALDPDASVNTNVSPIDELREHIASNMSDFVNGHINVANLKNCIDSGESISIRAIDQVRFNGADLLPMVGDKDLYDYLSEGEAIQLFDDVTDRWNMKVCGDMLEQMDGLYILVLFGVKPHEDVINAFKTGVLYCSNIDNMDTQEAIFSNYDKFVNDVLTGVDFSDKITVNISDGYDS